MHYVAEHTSVPIPKVLATHTYQGRLYIEMEFIRGTGLDTLWIQDRLSATEKAALLTELQGYVSQLRKIEVSEQSLVASSSLTSGIRDSRIGPDAVGPISHDDFHAVLRGNLPLQDTAQVFGEAVAPVHSKQYRSYFTHADLVPRNIIVRKGRIAAIIDWGFSGWYPEYWEFTKAHYDALPRQDWHEGLREAIRPYDAELACERALWRQYDQPQLAN